MIPIVIGALGTVPKGLIKGAEVFVIGGRAESRRTAATLWGVAFRT